MCRFLSSKKSGSTRSGTNLQALHLEIANEYDKSYKDLQRSLRNHGNCLPCELVRTRELRNLQKRLDTATDAQLEAFKLGPDAPF